MNQEPTDVIEQQALGVLHDWRTARTRPIQQLSRMLSQASQEYSDRFLIELIQNGSDAHARSTRDGRILVMLDATDGDHGSMLIANTGRPFTKSNFEALASLGLSDKPAGEGIGNKGLGFKSVLQVTDWPEVYSQDPSARGSDHFYGYSFGFADESALSSLVPDPAERARAADEISRYLLPVPRPVHSQDENICELAAQGYATVVRLRLKSGAARDAAEDRMRELLDPTTPLLLFLDRLSEIVFTWRTDGSDETVRITRHCERSATLPGADKVSASQIDLGDAGKFVVLEYALEREEVARALRSSIDAGHVDEKWASWDGDAVVAVALKAGEETQVGRLYTYLPMGEHCKAPLHAHVHAPFFVKLARTDLNFDVDYNRALLDGIAHLCAVAARAFARSSQIADARNSADLITWSEHLDILREAFDATGTPLTESPVVATICTDSGARATLDAVRVWDFERTSVLTPTWLAAQLDVALVDPALGRDRIGRLRELGSELLDRDLAPNTDELGVWTERCAFDLLNEAWDAARWMAFYDDVSVVWNDHGSHALHGRRLLIDNDRRLQCAGKSDGPTVFFFPERGVQGEEEVEGALDLELPRGLQRYLTFTHRELRWYDGVRATRARTFFGNLVRRYQTAEVLEEIGSISARKHADSVFQDALRLAFRLHGRVGARPKLDALNLRVPTRSGWIDARRARFSRSWPVSAAQLLDRLVEESGDLSGELGDLRARLLLSPSEWLRDGEDLEAWVAFLERIGVRHGLWPEPPRSVELVGGEYTAPAVARRLRLAEEQAQAFIASAPVKNGFPEFPYTEYTSVFGFWSFPGQGEASSLPSSAQRVYAELVIRALARLDSSHMTAGVRRKNHQTDALSMWPTPISVFLSSASWLPVRRRGQEVLDVPHHAWLFDERGPAPAWAPVVPQDLAKLIEGKSLDALRKAGLRIWSDEGHAPALLETLVDLVRNAEVAPNPERLFIRTVEEAWHRVVRPKNAASPEWSPRYVVVRAGDRVKAVDLTIEGPEALYIDDGSNPPLIRALRDTGAAALCARPSDGPRIAEHLRGAARPIRLLGEVDIRVEADGAPFVPDEADPTVVSIVGNWLTLLVQGALEFRSGQFRRHSPETLRSASEAVRQLRLRRVDSVFVTVGDKRIAESAENRGVVLVPDEAVPTVLVRGFDGDRWNLAESVTRPLAQLIEVPDLKSVLFEAIVHIRREVAATGVENPSRAQIATSLDLNEADLDEAGALVRLSTIEFSTRLAVLIGVQVGLEAAQAFLVSAQAVDSDVEVERLARGFLSVPVEWLHQIREVGEVGDLRSKLGLDFAPFDAALRAFGLPSIADPDGQAQYFAAFVEVNRTKVVDALRAASLKEFRRRRSLERYVQLRELPGLSADPAWVHECERPSSDQMLTRISAWLSQRGASIDHADILSPLDEVRVRNSAIVRDVARVATDLIRAWCNYRRVLPHAVWMHATGTQAIVDWASDRGFIDFDLLDRERVLDELARGGLWPPEMPVTFELGELGLSTDALAIERDRETQERLARERERRTVAVGDDRFGTSSEDLYRLMDLLTASVGPSFLERSGRATLADPPAEPTRRNQRGRGRRHVGGQRGRLTEDQATVVGFAGEVIAREWLLSQFPDSQVFWASGYRDLVLGGTEGSDDLGYDIRIADEEGLRYYEVKATSGDDLAFDLTPGEAEFARKARPKRAFAILYVRRALEPDNCSVLLLPNPFSADGRRCYRESGGLHLDFRLR